MSLSPLSLVVQVEPGAESHSLELVTGDYHLNYILFNDYCKSTLDHFIHHLAVFDPHHMPFEFEHLLTIEPIEILLQFTTDRESALLQPPVRLVGRTRGAKAMAAATEARYALVWLKEGLDGLSGFELIVFDDNPGKLFPGLDNLDGQTVLARRASPVTALPVSSQ